MFVLIHGPTSVGSDRKEIAVYVSREGLVV